MTGKCKTVFPLVVVDNQQQQVLFPVLLQDHHQHVGDYGFDPHLHYLQVLEEARKQGGKENGRLNYLFTPEIPYYLSKQEEEERSEKKRKGKRKWWNPSSIFSFKKKWKRSDSPATMTVTTTESLKLRDVRPAVKSYSGPIYDAGGGFSCRRSRPATPSCHKGGGDEELDDVPYWNLRDLNFSRFSTSAAPIYLVT